MDLKLVPSALKRSIFLSIVYICCMVSLIQVYCHTSTPRLKYALNLVFRNILGVDYQITQKPDPTLPLINYSDDKSVGGVFIQPEPLLFETGVSKQDIWIAHIDKLPLFYQQPPEAVFPLDIFAFAFFLTSRYEEYLSSYTDEHGRFASELSIAYRHNFLDIPVVDIWTLRLAKTLRILYPGLKLKMRKFTSMLTVDIDQPFAYRSKGLLRNAGGFFVDIVKKRSPWLRMKCITRRVKDPYDTFDYILETASSAGAEITWFVSAGKRSKFDLNPDPGTGCYRRLIRKLSEHGRVALHPSWLSSLENQRLSAEKLALSKVTGKEITISRQHYLVLRLPETYRNLLDEGIREDHTMGFLRDYGFRAGIARPYNFYDLPAERETDLLVVPFQYMDGTYQQYKRSTPKEAMESIQKLVDITREVGGHFVSVWHNTSLTEKDGWSGWRDVFEYALRAQKP